MIKTSEYGPILLGYESLEFLIDHEQEFLEMEGACFVL